MNQKTPTRYENNIQYLVYSNTCKYEVYQKQTGSLEESNGQNSLVEFSGNRFYIRVPREVGGGRRSTASTNISC